MPIKRAALRQLRKDRVRAERNRAVRSELRTLKKRIFTLLDQGKRDDAQQLLPQVSKRFDQAVSKRLVQKNTAARLKSQLMRRLSG